MEMAESRPRIHDDDRDDEVASSGFERDREDDDEDVYGDDLTDEDYVEELEIKEGKSEYVDERDIGRDTRSLGQTRSLYDGEDDNQSHYGSEQSDDSDDLLPKFETSDLLTPAMNTKIVSTLIFLFSLFAMIFFTNGSSLGIIYLFVLLPLSFFGLYGSFMFHHKSLGIFSHGLFAWVLITLFTFGIAQVPGIDFLGEIANKRCQQESQPGFRCEIERFGIDGFPPPPDGCGDQEPDPRFKCETVVKTQLIWETWGTVIVFAFLLGYCSYSARKLYKEVKARSDQKKDEREMNMALESAKSNFLSDDENPLLHEEKED